MDNLAKLQRRKAELEAQIAQQRADLQETLREIRTEIEPAKLLKKAVGEAFGPAQSPSGGPRGQGVGNFLLDLLVRDSRLSLVLKLLAPLAIQYLPKLMGKKEAPVPELPEKTIETPTKTNVYGRLRQGVAALRGKLGGVGKTEN